MASSSPRSYCLVYASPLQLLVSDEALNLVKLILDISFTGILFKGNYCLTKVLHQWGGCCLKDGGGVKDSWGVSKCHAMAFNLRPWLA